MRNNSYTQHYPTFYPGGYRASGVFLLQQAFNGEHIQVHVPDQAEWFACWSLRDGDAAGDFVEKTGSGGIICFQDDLSNGR